MDGLIFKLSIMYSVTEQLPELFFTCQRAAQPNQTIDDGECDDIFAAAEAVDSSVQASDGEDIVEADQIILAEDF